MKKFLAIAASCWQALPRRPSTLSSLVAVPFASIPIVAPCSIPGVYDNTGNKAKRWRGEESDLSEQEDSATGQDRPADRTRSDAPAPARSDQAARHRRGLPFPLPPRRPRLRRPTRPPPRQPLRPQILRRHLRQPRRFGKTLLPAAGQVPRRRPPSQPQRQQAAAPAPSQSFVSAENSPLGVWLTEQKEGKIGSNNAAPIFAAIRSTRSRTRTANRF